MEDLFPITGIWREFLLYQEWIICFLLIQFALIIWLKGNKIKTKFGNLQELAFTSLLIGYGLMYIFIIFNDFYITEPDVRYFFIKIEYTLHMITVVFFYYFMEKSKKQKNKFIFATIQLALLLIFIVMNYLMIEVAFYVIIYTYNSILVVYIVIFLRNLVLNEEIKKILRNYRFFKLWALLSSIFLSMGLLLTQDFLVDAHGLIFRFWGNLFQMFSFFTFIFLFQMIRSFSGVGWRRYLDKVFILMNSGLGIYGKDLKSDFLLEYSVISGQFKSIQAALETMTNQEGSTIIQEGEQTLIIMPYKNLIGVLIIDTYFNSFKYILLSLLEQIYYYYGKIIENWNHNLHVFEPINDLVKNFFE